MSLQDLQILYQDANYKIEIAGIYLFTGKQVPYCSWMAKRYGRFIMIFSKAAGWNSFCKPAIFDRNNPIIQQLLFGKNGIVEI